MATSSSEDILKLEVVLIGDYNVGKTSLIQKIRKDGFPFYETIADLKNVEYRFRVSSTLTKNLAVRITDTAGMEYGGVISRPTFTGTRTGLSLRGTYQTQIRTDI